MKLITAVVKPFTVSRIMEALEAVGICGIALTEAQGRGRQRSKIEYYRGARYASPFVSKSKIEVLVPESLLDEALDAVCQAAFTGEVGDGKIWVTAVENVIRVRTGERDNAAILG